MGNITKRFVKDSDNEIKLRFTENGSAVSITWTEIQLQIGSLVLTRTANERGIDFTSGILTVTPGSIDEDLSSLITGSLLRCYLTVKSAVFINGVIFGASDSENSFHFVISDPT